MHTSDWWHDTFVSAFIIHSAHRLHTVARLWLASTQSALSLSLALSLVLAPARPLARSRSVWAQQFAVSTEIASPRKTHLFATATTICTTHTSQRFSKCLNSTTTTTVCSSGFFSHADTGAVYQFTAHTRFIRNNRWNTCSTHSNSIELYAKRQSRGNVAGRRCGAARPIEVGELSPNEVISLALYEYASVFDDRYAATLRSPSHGNGNCLCSVRQPSPRTPTIWCGFSNCTMHRHTYIEQQLYTETRTAQLVRFGRFVLCAVHGFIWYKYSDDNWISVFAREKEPQYIYMHVRFAYINRGTRTCAHAHTPTQNYKSNSPQFGSGPNKLQRTETRTSKQHKTK